MQGGTHTECIQKSLFIGIRVGLTDPMHSLPYIHPYLITYIKGYLIYEHNIVFGRRARTT